ncbi:hypothetical protein OS493_010998 [Desmophyllum pertusum]|uniref:Uncharacterized protein n=1 Tax=Desmophyllum pertusum TaxID=174260 RepID=A0A9W9ZEN6_9CNID|nr:hypothetical protein OS493_010998 [Desmophyllum pertusum]
MESKVESDDKKTILNVLNKMSNPKELKGRDVKKPSQVAQSIGPNFTNGTKKKITAVTESFSQIETIDVKPEKRERKATTKTCGKESTSTSSPQKNGTDHHAKLAAQINIEKENREGIAGKVLNEMEDKFECIFLKAEVNITGCAVIKSNRDFYSGIMDAVAIRRRSSPEDDLEVYVVDWKTTTSETADLATWWKKATCFKIPLYQCLIYRELLQVHLKLHQIDARVGIMLVPFHQSQPELLMPRLCMDVQEMENEGLLDGLKEYEWFPNESSCVHAIKSPSKLFNLKRCDSDCVDENNLLREDALLKDIIREDATIADLRQELGLLELQVPVKRQTHFWPD